MSWNSLSWFPGGDVERQTWRTEIFRENINPHLKFSLGRRDKHDKVLALWSCCATSGDHHAIFGSTHKRSLAGMDCVTIPKKPHLLWLSLIPLPLEPDLKDYRPESRGYVVCLFGVVLEGHSAHSPEWMADKINFYFAMARFSLSVANINVTRLRK